MTITQFGRVELDPNLVPSAAPGQRSDIDGAPFARELSAARRREDSRAPERDRSSESAPPPAESPSAEQGPRSERAERSQPTARPDAPAADAEPVTPAADVTPTSTHTGAEAAPRRISKGKASATSASTPQTNATAPAMVATPSDATATRDVPTFATVATNGAPAAAATAAKGASVAPTATAATEARAPRPQTGVRAAPAYSGFDPRAVERLEAARDSIFRQIALRVGTENSEMRVLLAPPELGHLDLQVIVEKGGALRLSIVAERPELAAMLERQAGDLKQLLEEKGFTDVQTHVQAGDSGAQHQAGFDHRRSSHQAMGDADTDRDASPAELRRAGFTVGEGIDFWA